MEEALIWEEMLSRGLAETLWWLVVILLQLCLSDLMPFVSYFLQFTRLAPHLADQGLMSIDEENRNKHSLAEPLPTSDPERVASRRTHKLPVCPALYTQPAKLPTAVYSSNPTPPYIVWLLL